MDDKESTWLLAASIAHEINNPLQGVMGCLSALRDGEIPKDRQETYYASIQEGLERIRDTVQDLLRRARDQGTHGRRLMDVLASVLLIGVNTAKERGEVMIVLKTGKGPADEDFTIERTQEHATVVTVWLRTPKVNMLKILLIDDEAAIRMSIGDVLTAVGYHVTLCGDGTQAMELIGAEVFDLVITDIHLPRLSGLEIFRRVRTEAPGTDVILMTAYGAVEDAVAALKEGARDYLLKPFDLEELLIRVARIAEARELRRELSAARSEISSRSEDGGIIGRVPLMVRLQERIQMMAQSEAPVLITGESGTGKELVARQLHQLSSRRDRPFVAVNCAAFPETLIEAELFGHERGAFTGAVKRREGRFKAADGGTLFLDEVAEIPLPTQVKLLRVLQEGTIEPLGTNTATHVDVRVLSATHRSLKRFIADERFREDLYYRLNVLDISIPPLRERKGDLPVLIKSFLTSLTPPGEKLPSLSPRAFSALSEYSFPGNVRELKHAIEHAMVLCRGGEIDLEHLPTDIRGAHRDEEPGGNKPPPTFRPLGTAVKEFEREYLLRALDAAKGKKSQTADLLGISRKNLWEKLRSHGISESDTED